MKPITIFILALLPFCAFADEPSTSCPSGYETITETYIEIANSSCPSGYTYVGTATSCLISSPSGSCMMYAPTGISYTDSSGTYQFTSACPLK